jgi:DNA (cytosine-5)-methyltransferase 1
MEKTERSVNATECNGESGYAADTTEQYREWLRFEQSEISRAEQEQLRRRGCEDGGIAGCRRWDTFPSVSPIHRRDDGFPFPLDCIAIPFDKGNSDDFTKWRTEALKAYGNAIVPQVMYEIFRAIEIVEQREQR